MGPDGAGGHRHPGRIRFLPGAADLAFHDREAEIGRGRLKMALFVLTLQDETNIPRIVSER